MNTMILLLFVFLLSTFLGFEIISRVPSKLHTPLMSGANAIHGITILGAMAAAGMAGNGPLEQLAAFAAVVFATVNVVGGFTVTDRMLAMFRKRKPEKVPVKKSGKGTDMDSHK